VGGFIPFSLLDYPGRVAAVIFTRGCNFRCPYCHNPLLLPEDAPSPGLSEAGILNFLSTRAGMLEGVVISGGEPTIHDGLPAFIREIKSMGFMVKLDTNGSNPGSLSFLLGSGLIDYVAMDVKAGPEAYQHAAGVPVERERILESVRLVKNLPEHEFRTTLFPGMAFPSDLLAITGMLREEKATAHYVIQNFRPGNCLDSRLNGQEPFTEERMLAFRDMVLPFFSSVSMR